MPPDVGSPREWNGKYYVRITTLEFAAEGTRVLPARADSGSSCLSRGSYRRMNCRERWISGWYGRLSIDSQFRGRILRHPEQWRICFPWTRTGPEDVEIVDYH